MKNPDHRTAQIDLNEKLFPHYVLGRQLALEQVLRELLDALPTEKIEPIRERLQLESDLGMQRIQDQDPLEDTPDHVSDCGYVCGLIQMVR